MKTFDGGLSGLYMFFSIQLQMLHFSWAFLKEQLSAIFLNFLWLAMKYVSSSHDPSLRTKTVELNLFVLIGVRAGGARGAAAPPNFGQLRFFGQQEKIWAKPAFKDVSMFFY